LICVLHKGETADFKTSKDFTRLQQLGLQIFERLQETSSDFMRLHKTSMDFTRLQGTSRDFNRLHETSYTRENQRIPRLQDFKRLHETSRDFTRLPRLYG